MLPLCSTLTHDKMAVPIHNLVRAVCRISPVILRRSNQAQKLHNGGRILFPSVRDFCNSAKLSSDGAASEVDTLEAHSRYKDTPWEYLESEEYIERYGSKPVWADYRRNHKGGIPPQKTRKTCIRGKNICGNPCPICRDPNVIIHYQNVNLLQQFISPYTGIVYDPTRTGVCMKQQNLLNKAIQTAREHGLISTQLPFVDYSGEDFSNSHGAVCRTPMLPAYSHGEPWYEWYGDIKPDPRELARVKKIYKDYLK